MHTTWSQQNWSNNNSSIQRHVIALVVSIMIVSLLLLLPLKKNINLLQETTQITIDLFKPQPKLNETLAKPAMPKQVTEIDGNISKTIKPKPEPVKTIPIPRVIDELPKKSTNKLPSIGVILNSIAGKNKLFELDNDFQARTGNPDDFKFKTFAEPKWSKVTKLIDEEVDKPQYHMNFYAEGIVGATEKFFDKISYSKKFTTRYGTKIYCGGVGPLIMCSWK